MPGSGYGTYEEIREELSDELIWRKKYLIFNQTSVEGNKIRGQCYTKTLIKKLKSKTFGNYSIKRIYATRKELFYYKLRHNNEN